MNTVFVKILVSVYERSKFNQNSVFMSISLTVNAFEQGLIVPDNNVTFLDIVYYHEEAKFCNRQLENRRKLCPDLFRVGSNVLPDTSEYLLNVTLKPLLEIEFPDVPFDTPQDFKNFLETPTFYRVDEINSDQEDILGNEYALLHVVFIKICPGNVLGQYELYSLQELISTFMYYREFVNPACITERFSQSQIARLQKLCLQSAEASVLLHIINALSTEVSQNALYIQNYKDDSYQFLKDLLEVAMRMRGWSGQGTYPLRADSTHTAVDEIVLLEKIWNIYQSEHSALNLPLIVEPNIMRYSVDPAHGLTVSERLKIVLQNKDGYACIRLSSNWLATTAWYYLNKFYNEVPFDISELERIQ